MEMKDQILKAKESKHTDAILTLLEKKSEIQSQFSELYKKSFGSDEKTPQAETIKKAVSLVAEFVFNSCVEILSNDKKSDE